jgi:ribosomal protein L11 methylase PrmA
MSNSVQHPASYRDPSGFIYVQEGIVYRQVNQFYREHFDLFINSGCYQQLVAAGLLISHEQVADNLLNSKDWYTTLKPEPVSLVSYAYEWSFDMLKDAALLTLRILKQALQSGLILKDATPYNIQWHKGKLVFIDTLSFEKYEEKPWIAYRQFCECFLAPLLVMYYTKRPLQQLMLAWPDGIPLDIAASLLPRKSRFSVHTYLHIHLHAKVSAKQKTGAQAGNTAEVFAKSKLDRLIDSLEILINKLQIPDLESTWSHYYQEASQRNGYLEAKKEIIDGWLTGLPQLQTAADLGANEGEFSKLVAAKNINTVAADFDPYCINNLYRHIKKNGVKNIQPVILDLSQPSPANGLNYAERSNFSQRLQVDLVLALAVIHHLAIGKNIPLDKIASFFAPVAPYLLIEFVPKQDPKTQLLLQHKQDIYPQYTEAGFLAAFEPLFTIERQKVVPHSERILFLLKRK